MADLSFWECIILGFSLPKNTDKHDFSAVNQLRKEKTNTVYYDQTGMNEIYSTDSQILSRFQSWLDIRLQPVHFQQ